MTFVETTGTRAAPVEPKCQNTVPCRRPVYMAETLVEITGNHDILRGLTDGERQAVLKRSVVQIREYGDAIFQQGQPHRGIFLIKSGRVRTYYASSVGREITLGHWTAGYFVGGPEIFGAGVHMWSAKAMERTEINFIAARDLRQLIVQFPSLAVGLVDGLSYAGKCYSGLLQILGTRPARGRLAHLLLTLAEREVGLQSPQMIFTRDMSHEELASMIGATRQWVTISLRHFERVGILAIEKDRVVILDKERLQDQSIAE